MRILMKTESFENKIHLISLSINSIIDGIQKIETTIHKWQLKRILDSLSIYKFIDTIWWGTRKYQKTNKRKANKIHCLLIIISPFLNTSPAHSPFLLFLLLDLFFHPKKKKQKNGWLLFPKNWVEYISSHFKEEFC